MLTKFFSLLNTLLTKLSLVLIFIYQKTISPDEGLLSPVLRGTVCAHEPHCSEYARLSLVRYGFLDSIEQIITRIISCRPSMTKTYDPVSYRVVFASSAPIGVPFLQALANDPRFDIVGIVTQPDQPSGRGLKMQENIIRQEGKKIIENSICRYFFLKKSLYTNWETVFLQQGIDWEMHEDWGIIVYGTLGTHNTYIHQFQKLLREGTWYFDTRGAYNEIIFKDRIFDLRSGEEEQAKNYGREIGIPEKQLDWSAESNKNIWSNVITTPNTLRLESKKYPGEGVQFQSWLESKKPDFLVVIAYGNIIPQHILDIPAIAPINVHGSLLPAYRGASPIQSVLLDDQSETGITIMRMDAGLDTGPMLRKQGFPLTIHTTALDIIHQFQEFGPQLLIDTMVDYATNKVTETIQPEDGVSHCSKLEKTHGLINPWTQSLHEINNIYRGCYLWPKTYFMLDDSRGKHAGKQIIIDTLELDDTLWETHKNLPLFVTDVSLTKGELKGDLVKNSQLNPAITTLLIKPEGSKAMKWEDWLRGI